MARRHLLQLMGCASQEQTGAVVGGVTGAVIGSQVGRGEGKHVAIAIGAIAGTMIGASIGRHMDEQDPDTSIDYSMTPTRTFRGQDGPCREFTMDAVIGDRRESVYGAACRQPDGSWLITK